MPKQWRQDRIQHPVAHEFYHYMLGYRFDPGAEAEVFESKFALPVTLYRGAARLAGALNVVQQPQVWFTQQVGVTGVPRQAGYLRGTPLLDPIQIGEGGAG